MDRPDYKTIIAAKGGLPEAMQSIVRYYKGYIVSLASHTVYDEDNVPHNIVDPEMIKQIKNELAIKIVFKFDPARLPEGETLEP